MNKQQYINTFNRKALRIARKHRRKVLAVIRKYGTDLKAAIEKTTPNVAMLNIAIIMPVQPMQEAVFAIWEDAAIEFSKFTAQQLGVKKNYAPMTEAKRDPRLLLAEIMETRPDLLEIYRNLFLYFDQYGAARVKTIVDGMQTLGKERIQEALTDAANLGLGEKEAAALLNRYIDESWKTSLFVAERIVRTETHAAANYSSLLEAQRTGAKVKKVWYCSFNKISRTTHIAADGQTVALNEKFRVGDALLSIPSDPEVRTHPEETINCQCAIGYVRE